MAAATTEYCAPAPAATVAAAGWVEIVGPELTFSVKTCVVLPPVFVAVMVNVKGEPAVVDGGAAVIRPALLRDATVGGREPAVMLKVGAGEPVATTWYVAALPTTNVVEAALVKTGGWFTVSVKTWVAAGATPLLACTVNEKGEPTAVDGTPERTPAEESERPGGRVPTDTEYVGVGEPVAVKVKEPRPPRAKVALFALVIAGTVAIEPRRIALFPSSTTKRLAERSLAIASGLLNLAAVASPSAVPETPADPAIVVTSWVEITIRRRVWLSASATKRVVPALSIAIPSG